MLTQADCQKAAALSVSCPWVDRLPVKWLFRLIFTLALVILAIGSLLPRDMVPPHPYSDKVLHFSGYAIVSALAMLSVRGFRRQCLCMLCLTVVGISLEFAQLLVPGRAFELWDMAANGCGVYFAFQVMRNVLY